MAQVTYPTMGHVYGEDVIRRLAGIQLQPVLCPSFDGIRAARGGERRPHGMLRDQRATASSLSSACELSTALRLVIGVTAGRRADHTRLLIMDSSIEADPGSDARYLIMALGKAPNAQRAKTPAGITTPDRPGACRACPSDLALRRVSLCRIRSRARPRRPCQYVLYLVFEGHAQDPIREAAIVGLLGRSSFNEMPGSRLAATARINEPDHEEVG